MRKGELERDKVKAIAVTMEHRIPLHADPGRRKFPLNSEYMAPNAMWSPRQVEDPWYPHYLQDPEHQASEENLNQQETIYSESQVYSRRPKQSDDHPFLQDHPVDRSQIPREGALGRDGIYECLQPRSSIPELPPKIPAKFPSGLSAIMSNHELDKLPSQVRLHIDIE